MNEQQMSYGCGALAIICTTFFLVNLINRFNLDTTNCVNHGGSVVIGAGHSAYECVAPTVKESP